MSGLRLAAALVAAQALPAATHADQGTNAANAAWGARAAMLMYYTGKAGDTKQIGVAVSRDGVHFTKHPGNPVIPVGPPESFDEFEVSNPMVVISGRQYHLYYAAKGVNEAGEEVETTGLAVSDDGVSWTKVGRALDVGLPGTFDEFEVSDPGMTRVALRGRSGPFQGQPVLLNYYTAVSGDTSVDPEGRRSIGMAFSPDGRDWFKVARPVIEHGPDGAFDALRVGNVEPELLQNSVFAYYGGIKQHVETGWVYDANAM
jgi:predicted GH43/DUF377 family glycosyl hydrolase